MCYSNDYVDIVQTESEAEVQTLLDNLGLREKQQFVRNACLPRVHICLKL